MKKFKILLLALCAVLLVVGSVLGTLAYLTAQDTVVNTFTVGKVDISLDETEVSTNGVPVEPTNRVKTNNYHLIPGQTYVKDPTVTVIKGSEESYVRMLVTLNCYKELKAIFGDGFLPQYFVEGWNDSTWTSTRVVSEDPVANTATYEFRYYTTITPANDANSVLAPLFTHITVPGTVTGEELATIASLKITVVGNAIQKSGFNTADEAWDAFDRQMGK